MTTKVKEIVRNQINSQYGKEMIEIYGLRYVKKEIFHAIKNEKGDTRSIKYYHEN